MSDEQDQANSGTDRLESYRAKRDLGRSTEPTGDEAVEDLPQPVYLVQKHDASQLHYDLRLQVVDVLASWAVPKGPSTDPATRRLAMRTEDHPLAYAAFEGVIPEGEYGGGTVMVWDRGTFQNLWEEKDEPRTMAECLDEGRIEIRVEGEKLQGGYALIRTSKPEEERERWLLIKMKDDHAQRDVDITEEQPDSVLSGRNLEEIAEESPAESPEMDKDEK